MDGRVSRAQKAREVRRAAVLQAARRVFYEKGYSGASIDDIIEAADIARGTFYLYFESKRAIFDELLEELFVTLQSKVSRIDVTPGAPPPVEQMDATVDKVFATQDTHQRSPRPRPSTLLQKRGEFRRDAIHCDWTKALALTGPQDSLRALAKACRLLQHRVEHWREVAGGGINDLQYLGGGSLLLQRLARLG